MANNLGAKSANWPILLSIVVLLESWTCTQVRLESNFFGGLELGLGFRLEHGRRGSIQGEWVVPICGYMHIA